MTLLATRIIFTLLIASPIFAQTWTDCNPLNETCDPDTGLSSSNYIVNFTEGADDSAWSVTAGNISYTSAGAEFTINEKGDSPTIETNWYFFFGRIEVHMKTAYGQGIVSSIVLESDVLDEVDWEWLGGVANQVQSDYFGKGNSTVGNRVGYHNLTDTQVNSHNYTVDWTKNSITWYIDGSPVRILEYDEALGGNNYPQTPMRLKLGIWAGGDSDNSQGTIDWAGGETDYSEGPFTMTVETVKVYNANPAAEYKYSDETGSYDSIEIIESNSGSSSSSGSNSTATSTSSTTSTTSSQGLSFSSSNSIVSSASTLLWKTDLWFKVAANIFVLYFLS